MRDEAPVYHSEQWGWYALTRFEDVRAAITDPDTFRSFEGMDIDDTGKEQKAPGSLPDMLGDYELSSPPVFCPSSPNMYVWNNVPVTFPTSARR